jgi:hypothetical protein
VQAVSPDFPVCSGGACGSLPLPQDHQTKPVSRRNYPQFGVSFHGADSVGGGGGSKVISESVESFYGRNNGAWEKLLCG